MKIQTAKTMCRNYVAYRSKIEARRTRFAKIETAHKRREITKCEATEMRDVIPVVPKRNFTPKLIEAIEAVLNHLPATDHDIYSAKAGDMNGAFNGEARR